MMLHMLHATVLACSTLSLLMILHCVDAFIIIDQSLTTRPSLLSSHELSTRHHRASNVVYDCTKLYSFTATNDESADDSSDGEDTTGITSKKDGNSGEDSINNEDSYSLSFDKSLHKNRVLTKCFVAIILYMAVGVLSFSRLFEKWPIVDSLYFSVVTFTTVG